MMRARIARSWKLVIVVAAALATFSFFKPFIAVEGELDGNTITYGMSGYVIVSEFDQVGAIARWNHISSQKGVTVENFNGPARPPVRYYYLAAATLLLVSLLALARRRLRFFGALFTVAAGLCALWCWTHEILLDRRLAETADTSSHLAIGCTLLGVAGVLALIAGIGGLVWPDPGGFRARATIGARVRVGDAAIAVAMPTDATNVPRAVLRPPKT